MESAESEIPNLAQRASWGAFLALAVAKGEIAAAKSSVHEIIRLRHSRYYVVIVRDI